MSFLSRFEGSQLPSSVLRSVTLVDTPGILSGEKQRVNRGYDFTKVVAWFAEVSAVSFQSRNGVSSNKDKCADDDFLMPARRFDYSVVRCP